MLSSKLFDSLTISTHLNNFFERLGDYDDPHFVLLSCEDDIDTATDTLSEMINNSDDDIYGGTLFPLTPTLKLFALSAEAEGAQALAREAIASSPAQSATTHIVVFHHNCLGDARETFKWAIQLMEQLIAISPNESAYRINDFELDDWPGLEQFMTQD
uniref:hypothetical protein n=1 Tax=Thaumasiovibrio occultus TaxID=1891184 RepID=UPI000B35450F|nr:hypothetical protein [Thaumasiovibrio occultus]